MNSFTFINMSQLPPVPVLNKVSFEQSKAEIIADYKQRNPEAILLESDPAMAVIETMAYRDMMMNQRINDGINAALLASDTAMLDWLGYRFGAERQVITPADDTTIQPVAAVLEDNERFRQRIQLASEGFSTAGPVGAYVFHALNASPLVKDVAIDAPEFAHVELDAALVAQLPANVIVLECIHQAGLVNPMPGDVAITTLSTQGNGLPDELLASTVLSALSADDVRPLTDHVRRRDCGIVEYTVDAELTLYNGPDGQTVLAAAKAAVDNYVQAQHMLGRDVVLAGLNAALFQPGVQNVALNSPVADIVVDGHQAAYCTATNVVIGGRDEQ